MSGQQKLELWLCVLAALTLLSIGSMITAYEMKKLELQQQQLKKQAAE
jgi:hypothetical protein